jgi:hypothetical protein
MSQDTLQCLLRHVSSWYEGILLITKMSIYLIASYAAYARILRLKGGVPGQIKQNKLLLFGRASLQAPVCVSGAGGP